MYGLPVSLEFAHPLCSLIILFSNAVQKPRPIQAKFVCIEDEKSTFTNLPRYIFLLEMLHRELCGEQHAHTMLEKYTHYTMQAMYTAKQ